MIFFAVLLILLASLAWLVLKPVTYNNDQSFTVKVLAYSQSIYNARAITFYLMYPRFIHAEMMTHKDFSRSAASSRAMPVMKVLAQVWNRPAMPIHWGVNIPGMQAKTELTGWKRTAAINLWMLAGKVACCITYLMVRLNLHKQTANRILEPWQLMHVTLTTAKLTNFFNLRIHPDAQPEICLLATMMRDKLNNSKMRILKEGEWHLPWVDFQDTKAAYEASEHFKMPYMEILVRISAARCARSSYATFDGDRNIRKDLALYDKLVTTKPVHASPAEHQVTPDSKHVMLFKYNIQDNLQSDLVWRLPTLHGNMTGWIQHRRQIPEHYFEG